MKNDKANRLLVWAIDDLNAAIGKIKSAEYEESKAGLLVSEVAWEQFQPETLASMLVEMDFANAEAGTETDELWREVRSALVKEVGWDRADEYIADAQK